MWNWFGTKSETSLYIKVMENCKWCMKERYRPLVSILCAAKGHIRFFGLIRGSRLDKSQIVYLTFSIIV